MLWVIDVAVHSFFWNIFVNGLHRFFLVENIVDHLHGSEDLHVHKKRHPCFGVRCLKYPSKWQVCSNTQKKEEFTASLHHHPPTHPPSHHHHRLWKWCMRWPWTRGPSCWTCHGGRRCWGAPVSPGPLCLVGWQVHRNATLENDENDSVSLQASTDIMISKDSF